MKKILKTLTTIVKTCFAIVIVAFIMAVCIQRFSNNKLSFMNYRIFTVVTGSMVPKYAVGDVLISKETDPYKIKKGDTISYLGNSGSFNGKIVTHEVINIEKDKDNNLLFHTKGLANLIEDPIVTSNQIYGVVIHKVLILSWIYKMVSTKVGMLFLIIIPLIFIISSEIISSLIDKEEERRKINCQ